MLSSRVIMNNVHYNQWSDSDQANFRQWLSEECTGASVPATFDLPHEAIVTFFIVDSYHDDKGGLTFHLKEN